ncbi:SufE family protein [Stappia sp. ES.058]|uniref:SufE family protein n=1 Tax=Stappia sp. ES.058 TaxID=1881061 RepID=UPI00087B4E93|nr:SufE family protein [Stappia sp. ES.058]SDU45673.1 cysteine desulfuration protein SufE [Stappia sp. ES.058]
MRSIEDYMASLADRLGPGCGSGGPVIALMEMAGELPEMDPALKTEDALFHGCQSRVWLTLGFDPDARTVRVIADSDARIMRGLLSIAVNLYDGRSADEVASIPPDRLREAGMIELLAPSRANGFYRLLKHIHGYGAALAAERAELS